MQLSLIFSLPVLAFSEWAPIAVSAGNTLVQCYYRQVLLLEIGGSYFTDVS